MSWREIGDVASPDRDVSGSDVLEPGYRAEKRRLPAPRRADESDELAVSDVERYVVDRDDIPLEGLRDVAKLDVRHACRVWIPHFLTTGIDHMADAA